MFDVGFWELALIFGVGLIILGPERMPRVASQIGRWIGRARRTANMLRRQLEQEIAAADAPPPRKPKPLKPVNRPADTLEKESVEGGAKQSMDLPTVQKDIETEVAESPVAKDGDELEAQGKDAEQNTIGPASGL